MLQFFRMSLSTAFLVPLLCLILLESGFADDAAIGPTIPSPSAKTETAAREAYRSLWKEYEAACRPIWQEMLKTTPEEKLRQRFWLDAPLDTVGAAFGNRFIELATSYPGTIAGLLSLKLVITGRGFADSDRQVACGTVVDSFLGVELLRDEFYLWLHRPETAYVDQLCRSIIMCGKAPRELEGIVRFSLACLLIKEKSGSDEAFRAQEQEAVSLLASVARDYADLPHPFDTERGTLGDAARHTSFELQHLGIGDEAPNIIGEDASGNAFELSDYRGKVVMLVFCGEWCAPCRELQPYEKQLVSIHQGRPFSIVGINTDPKETLASAIKRENFPWRWWWDGGSTRGPIVTQWNVLSFPTILLLDYQGIIRAKYAGVSAVNRDDITAQIEMLLSATKDDPSSSNSDRKSE